MNGCHGHVDGADDGYVEKFFSTLSSEADQILFRAIINNPSHILHALLPPVKISQYSYLDTTIE